MQRGPWRFHSGLLWQVKDASADEVGNLAAALGHSSSDAVEMLESVARPAHLERTRFLSVRTDLDRLAILALHLKAPSLASEMCRRNLFEREMFIEGCSTWHGDLLKLAEIVAENNDVPLRSAIVLAAGGEPGEDVTVEDTEDWNSLLSTWHREEPDRLTHSATGWTLRRFGLALPVIQPSPEPIGDRNWHVNSLGMTMLVMPAGSFVRRDDDASDPIAQTVELSRFLLADREVTREQYQQFKDDPHAEKRWRNGQSGSGPDSPPEFVLLDLSTNAPPITQQHPAVDVTWYDAVLFCNWLSLREGLTPCYARTGEQETIGTNKYDAWRLVPDANGYRLPTEAEWEYACRAGTQTTYSFGNDVSRRDRYAVYRAAVPEVSASRLPNSWGLFDMHGNVREWCHDWYGPFGSETTLSDPAGPSNGESRVWRGGRSSTPPQT